MSPTEQRSTSTTSGGAIQAHQLSGARLDNLTQVPGASSSLSKKCLLAGAEVPLLRRSVQDTGDAIHSKPDAPRGRSRGRARMSPKRRRHTTWCAVTFPRPHSTISPPP